MSEILPSQEIEPGSIEEDVSSEVLRPTLDLPSNVIVAASHGVDNLPDFEGDLGEWDTSYAFKNLALRRNFTDVATGYEEDGVLSHFIRKQALGNSNVIKPPLYSRAVGDPNRPLGLNSIKPKDFNDVDVFDGVEGPSPELRALWREESIIAYHDKVLAQVMIKLEQEEGPIVIIDIHDTGDFVMNEDGSLEDRTTYLDDHGITGYPAAVVSDISRAEGSLSDDIVTEAFSDGFKEGLEEQEADLSNGYFLNDEYKGSITLQLGITLKASLLEIGGELGVGSELADRVNVIQIESSRSRLMDEATQEINVEGTYQEALAIQRGAEEASAIMEEQWIVRNAGSIAASASVQ